MNRMLMMGWAAIQMMWNKAWAYVTMAAAVVAALAVIYFKGKKDERTEIQRRVLETDLQNRRDSEAVRRDVAASGDPVERLRTEWSRPRR